MKNRFFPYTSPLSLHAPAPLVFYCLFMLYLFLPNNSLPISAQPSSHLKKHIDRIVVEQFDTPKPPFGIAIGIIDENYTYQYFYGRLSPELTSPPPDSSTLFALNALGKVFVTTVYAAMVQDSLILPNAPISQYLPDSVAQNPHLKDITLRHLATHTAGFPKNPDNASETALDTDNLLGNYNLQDLYAYLKKYKPSKTHQVGKFNYSHTGICLLSVILENAARQPFAQLLEKYVLIPLSMPHTTARPDTLPTSMLIAAGQDFSGKPAAPIKFQLLANIEGMYSNLTDMLSFLRINMTAADTSAIAQTHIAKANTATKWVKTALGWFVVSEGKNGPQILTHSGRAGGYSSYVGFEKSRGVGVVVLSNSARRCDEVGISIMELLLR